VADGLWKEVTIVRPRVSYEMRRVNDKVIWSMNRDLEAPIIQGRFVGETLLSIQNVVAEEVLDIMEET
jgi:hypothetical protein